MSMRQWYAARGLRFICRRGAKLLSRYRVTPAKAIQRLDNCVEALAGLGCAPTFPTPGSVVQRYPRFIRGLQDRGAEIAVHSYHHIDLQALPVAAAKQQLERAIQTFERFGIEACGFRCPYLGWSEELRDAIPPGMLAYSSNEAIYLGPDRLANDTGSEFFEAVRRFYRARLFAENLSVPSTRANLIEIPVCVPDDLQLHDGVGLDGEGLAQAWGGMLDEIYQRGELFALMFHPEMATLCLGPFASLLDKAKRYHHPVWIARLRDISDWWREKSRFAVECSEDTAGLRLDFSCSPRATILGRGLEPGDRGQPRNGGYRRLRAQTLDLPPGPRPFIGVPAHTPEGLVTFLRDQGYIVDASDTGTRCSLQLDPAALSGLTPVQIVEQIETSPGPLVRYWRWPDGARSALCITGDLDALTLLDYAGRLFGR